MVPNVSVVIPIYKVEPYIERCARSLFEQTLDEIEYIFVNDCTPDKSVDILTEVLAEYPHRQKQVVLLHHTSNMGAAQARLDGIHTAHGEYIIHCDSDDWVDHDMYRAMYAKAKRENLDMVICDWLISDGEKHAEEHQLLTSGQDLLSGLVDRSISGSLCCKLTSRKIYGTVKQFPIEHMMEDVAYSVQLVAACKKVGYLSECYYYYYNNPLSICHRVDEVSCVEKCRQACSNINIVLDFLKLHGLSDKYAKQIVKLKNSARVFLWPLLLNNNRSHYEMWRNVYTEINISYPFNTEVPLRLRIIFILSLWRVYPYIHKLFHKVI